MTTEYPFSLAQLAQILSALENERRNPNTKRNAIKAIARNAAQIGLSAEDVFDAADGLLSGRMSAADFRAALSDEACGPASFVIEPPAEPAPDDAADEAEEASIMPNTGPLAPAESGTRDEAAERAPTVATEHIAADSAATKTRVDVRQQLLAACRAAEHWLQAELDSPAKPAPTTSCACCAPPSSGPRRAEAARGASARPVTSFQPTPGESSKEAMLIDMLRRPEGATIAQIMAATGWQPHTVGGAFAGALKKKHGLTITSEKLDGGERIYRLPG